MEAKELRLFIARWAKVHRHHATASEIAQFSQYYIDQHPDGDYELSRVWDDEYQWRKIQVTV